jgi:hypothetical protein
MENCGKSLKLTPTPVTEIDVIAGWIAGKMTRLIGGMKEIA